MESFFEEQFNINSNSEDNVPKLEDSKQIFGELVPFEENSKDPLKKYWEYVDGIINQK